MIHNEHFPFDFIYIETKIFLFLLC